METGAIEQLEAAVDALAAEAVEPGMLGGTLARLEVVKRRLDAQVSRRVAVFDGSGEWAAAGAESSAVWLRSAWRMSRHDARTLVRTARQVGAMAKIGAAWAAGEVPSGHVEVLARARHGAKANDRFAELEDVFCEVAKAGLIEDVCNIARRWRDALGAEREPGTPPKQDDEAPNSLFVSEILDGVRVLNGQFDAESGEYIADAIQKEYDKLHHGDDPRSPAGQRADALASICRQYLDGQLGGANRPHVMFFGDEATFCGDGVGVCETVHGVQVSPEVLRRVACDSLVSRIIRDANGVVLDVGRAERTFTPDQYRALIAQYPTCVGIGCTVASADCRMHHIDWWEHGGRTDLARGAPLCWACHKKPHEQHWTMFREPDTGIVHWTDNLGTYRGAVHPRHHTKPIPIRDPQRQEERKLLDQRITELTQRMAA